MTEIITKTPPKIIKIGDFYEFYHGFDDYLADGWSLSFVIRGLSELAVTTTGSAFQLLSTETVNLLPGMHTSVIVASKGSDKRITLYQDRVDITADPTETGTLTDRTTHNQRMLAYVEAYIEGRATNGQIDHIKSVIRNNDNEKSLERMSLDELIKIRNDYKRAVDRELGRYLKAVIYYF